MNKFGEVSGMLTFASELVSHVASVDAGAKKERKKRARKEQLKAEADKLELVTKALEVFTLMHLTESWILNFVPFRFFFETENYFSSRNFSSF